MAFDFKMDCIENIGGSTTITIDDGGIVKFTNDNSIGDIQNVSTSVIAQKDLDKFIEIYLELKNLYK